MFELLHIADPVLYRAAGSHYVPADYTAVGFVHCCLPAQLSGVLERWFAEADSVLLLTLDGLALQEITRAEPGPGGQLFPHLYGEIPRSSVLAATPIERASDGRWVLPPLLPGRPIPSADSLARSFHQAYGSLASQHGLQILPGQADFEALAPSMQSLLVAAMGAVRREITGWGDGPDSA